MNRCMPFDFCIFVDILQKWFGAKEYQKKWSYAFAAAGIYYASQRTIALALSTRNLQNYANSTLMNGGGSTEKEIRTGIIEINAEPATVKTLLRFALKLLSGWEENAICALTAIIEFCRLTIRKAEEEKNVPKRDGDIENLCLKCPWNCWLKNINFFARIATRLNHGGGIHA